MLDNAQIKEINDKDQQTLNRLESTQAHLDYIIKAIKKDKSCKHIKPMLELTIRTLDQAKTILYNDKWYE